MSRKDQFLNRLISSRTYIALGLIALVVTASFILVNRAFHTYQSHAEVVKLATAQRTSSQRIAFAANALVNADSEEMRDHFRDAMRRAIREMEARHRILSLRSDAELIPPGMQEILRPIYFEGLHPFESKINAFLKNARALLDTPSEEFRPDLPQLLKLNLAALDDILYTHRLLAQLLQMETEEAVGQIRQLDALLWALTLVLLIMEVPLIFQPMANRAEQSMNAIETARRTAECAASDAEVAREGQASFIRTMSHELRTPLNAVLGMAQLLRLSKLTPKQEGYVDDIHRAGEDLLGLIGEILEFSRLEAAQVTIELAPTSLEEELDRVQNLYRPLAVKKGLELRCTIDPRLALFYRMDGARVRQVLTNLVANAIKFTHEGSICIRARLTGSAGPKFDSVRFEVEDTGIGIPDGVHERIFEEFQQADTSLSRKYGGTGLGLAICRRLVHLMNGQIGVESTEGAGSIFWFELALERSQAPDARTTSPVSSLKKAV